MPFAGDEHILGRMPASDLQQRLAQQFNTFTGLGRERDRRTGIVVMTLGRISGEIDLVVDGDSCQALGQLGENSLFGVADAATRIDQQNHDVGAFDFAPGALDTDFLDFVVAGAQPGGIDHMQRNSGDL